ncbi:hypothetical protein J4446_02090 [Candidatus Woesearchaeota archaeon]|nr:hypothetical protein [Candidatus Woesearchaeota archaeon]
MIALGLHIKTNIGFLIIFFSVIVLAIMQGGSISNAIIGREGVQGNEIQQIAFIILTLFILVVATLHPDKLYLSAYSSMTLGLIVIISAFFNIYRGEDGLNILQFILGVILIIGGVVLFRKGKLSQEDKKLVYEGIKNYKK